MIQRRGILIYPEELSPYWLERIEQTDLNLLGIHPAGGLTGGQAVEEAIHWRGLTQTQQLIDRLSRRGVDVEYEMHALSWLLPRVLFATRPDWFRMDENGVRDPGHHCCPSNPEALEYISARARALARIFVPTTGRYHFWLDDTKQTACHCPACAQMSASDAALTVYNAILAGVRSFDPKAGQCYLAYYDTLPPPRKVVPAEGIFLEYAPMTRDQTAALTDPASGNNREAVGMLGGLFEVFPKSGAKALDYWLDNSWYSEWKKPMKRFQFSPAIAAADARFYREAGFETVTCFACYLGEEYHALYGEHVDLAAYARALHGRIDL